MDSLIQNVGAGIYGLTVTDANNCTAETQAEIIEPDPLEIDLVINVQPCEGFGGGEIEAIVSGGTQPYLYEWSNGSTDAVISDLTAGMYYLTVTDNNGCEEMDSVLLEALPGLSVTLENQTATCLGGQTGSAEAVVTGGVGPLIYEWSNGETTAIATMLPAGLSTVVVTDANGCSGTAEVDIEEAEDPLDLYGLRCTGDFFSKWDGWSCRSFGPR